MPHHATTSHYAHHHLQLLMLTAYLLTVPPLVPLLQTPELLSDIELPNTVCAFGWPMWLRGESVCSWVAHVARRAPGWPLRLRGECHGGQGKSEKATSELEMLL